jgi:hypothetical protein
VHVANMRMVRLRMLQRVVKMMIVSIELAHAYGRVEIAVAVDAYDASSLCSVVPRVCGSGTSEFSLVGVEVEPEVRVELRLRRARV